MKFRMPVEYREDKVAIKPVVIKVPRPCIKRLKDGEKYFFGDKALTKEEYFEAFCCRVHDWNGKVCRDCHVTRLEDMLWKASPPCIKTDATFMRGHCNGSQFEKLPQLGEHYKKIAEAHGQNVKGKVYKTSLAAFPGDPRAWVDSRGDVEKLCYERGYDCEGAVNVKAARLDKEPEQKDVADDIVDDAVYDILEERGEPVKGKEVMELREKVKDKIKPHWSK